jgi:hypothetical protein
VNPALVDGLASVRVETVPLPPGTLGLALPSTNRILISPDAAGHGWFVDPSPAQDEEFANGVALPGSAAAGRMDLLTTVLHEMAHFTGQPDVDGPGLLDPTLSEGVRATGNLGAVFAARP